MKSKIILGLISLVVLLSCAQFKKKGIIKEGEQYDLSVREGWVFIKIDTPFVMRVVSFFPTLYDCGGFASAANCIGITKHNDTIRILSLCDNQKDINTDEWVLVKAATQPKFTVTINYYYVDSLTGNLFIPEIQRTTLKTAYGELERIK